MSLKKIVCSSSLLLLITSFPCAAQDPDLHIGKFSSGDLAGWKEETIWGAKKSTYALVKDNGRTVLLGKSNASASGLLHKVEIDPKAFPFINWSWKIDHTIKKGNERTKEGHDFAVRLYVVFPRGFFSRTRAIEYVWGNVVAAGEQIRNPYSNNIVMIAVDSGNERAGTWVTHTRNYAEDYRKTFGEEPPKVGAIAIMTDSDNTGEPSSGYYGDIHITRLPAAEEPKKPVPLEIRLKEGAAKDKGFEMPPTPAPKPPEPVPAPASPKQAP